MNLVTGRNLLLLVVLFLSRSVQGCSQEASGKLVCTSFPPCQLYQHTSYVQFRFADTTELTPFQLLNCHLNSAKLTFEFNNVVRVRPNAFSNLTLAPGSSLTFKFDASNTMGQAKNLIINQDAFKNLQLSKNSQVILEVLNYQEVCIFEAYFKYSRLYLIFSRYLWICYHTYKFRIHVELFIYKHHI